MSEVYFKDVDVLKGPILKLLKKEGYQAVDMHYHSCFSIDGLAKINQIVAKCRKDNIGVAFTDHNHIEAALKTTSLAPKDVFTLPGIEITCHNGSHVLLHFSDLKEYKEFYKKEMQKRIIKNPWFIDIDHTEVIDIAHNYNCLITAPHPFGPGFIGIKKFKPNSQTLRKINAIEVLNGCLVGEMNPKAIKWAKQLKKGFTGGSDGHCLKELGTSLTLCKAETREEFLEQIRKRKSIVIGKQERLFEDAVNAVHKFVREEKKAPKNQLEKMWKDRGLREWDYFKNKIEKSCLLHHFHAHHQNPTKKRLSEHKHTKQLTE
jgi:predicted metal-dependent phosphoesterase TrpH